MAKQKTKTREHQLHVFITSELRQALVRRAAEEDRTISAVVRRTLKKEMGL